MTRFRLTPPALRDLEEIAAFSLARWGEPQTLQYISALQQRFQWLAENPNLGRPRDDIAPGYRSFRQGSHIIFYAMTSDEIAIIGIPHSAMDIEAYFEHRDD